MKKTIENTIPTTQIKVNNNTPKIPIKKIAKDSTNSVSQTKKSKICGRIARRPILRSYEDLSLLFTHSIEPHEETKWQDKLDF